MWQLRPSAPEWDLTANHCSEDLGRRHVRMSHHAIAVVAVATVLNIIPRDQKAMV